jgi:glucose/arabinose dehydrogenase
MLVTERPGALRLVGVDGVVSPPLSGVPAVYASGQGGLLDVALSPSFAADRLVYLSFAKPGEGGASTAVARGRLRQDAGGLAGVETIFRQQPKVRGGRHFGSRLVFARDGRLFVTTGDRGQGSPVQDLSNHIGTVIRIEPDGRVPPDNPFVRVSGARPEIWSYGNRNGQGAAMHPETGALWQHEHGPRGGDEVNIIEPGRNYGWPLVSWGNEYSGATIPDPPIRPDLTDAIYQWTPVIAASGMAFYTRDLFPAWRGNLLVGGLVARAVVRLQLDGARRPRRADSARRAHPRRPRRPRRRRLSAERREQRQTAQADTGRKLTPVPMANAFAVVTAEVLRRWSGQGLRHPHPC